MSNQPSTLIDGNIGLHNADTFHNDVHKDLKADYLLANPPFNDSDWHRGDEDGKFDETSSTSFCAAN